MRLQGRTQGRWAGGLVAVSVGSLLLTLPHTYEDFVYGVPTSFGLTTLEAGSLLAGIYLVQVIGALLASRRDSVGYWLSLLVGLFWLAGSVLDHLDDVLLADVYRAGAASKLVEVGVMLVSAAIVILSLAALGRLPRQWRPR